MQSTFFKIDLLKTLACIAVVVLHCSSGVVGGFSMIENSVWWQGNIINSFTRWCVPAFLMVSGYLYFSGSSEKNNSELLVKRLLRIAGPFAFYGVIYIAFRYITEPEVNLPLILSEGLPYYHFWYLSMLFGLYVILFLFKKAGIRLDANITKVIVLLLVLMVCVLSQLNYFAFINWLEGIRYFPLALLGYYIFTLKKVNGWICLLVFVISSIAIACFTYESSLTKQQLYIKYYDYLGILCVLQTSSFVLFLLNTSFNASEKIKSLIMLISKNTLGIYLLHVLLLELFTRNMLGFTLNEFYIFNLRTAPVVAIFFTSAIVFILSFAIIYLLQKIRMLQRFVN